MRAATQNIKQRKIMEDMTFPKRKTGNKVSGRKFEKKNAPVKKSGIFLFSKFYAVLLLLVLSATVIPLAAFEAHVVNVTATIERPCVEFQVLSSGYWSTHEENWIFPQTLGADVISTPEEAADIFDLPQSSGHNRLAKQLLALKFNIAYFDAGSGFAPYQAVTVNQLAAEADYVLANSDSFSNLALNTMKDRVEAVNTAGVVSTCSAPDPDVIYELCFDEADNDGDGLIDFEDDDCDIFLPEEEEPVVEESSVPDGDAGGGDDGREDGGEDELEPEPESSPEPEPEPEPEPGL